MLRGLLYLICSFFCIAAGLCKTTLSTVTARQRVDYGSSKKIGIIGANHVGAIIAANALLCQGLVTELYISDTKWEALCKA